MVTLVTAFAITSAHAAGALYKFDFGTGKTKSGFSKVGNGAYDDEIGYGLDFGTTAQVIERTRGGKVNRDLLASDTPFYFSVKMPEGNYKVTVTLGDADEATETLVKSESRRLMFETVRTAPGEFVTREFIVNIRTPKINDTESIRLNQREYGKLDWDDKLTIEFNGAHPAVTSMVIEEAPKNTIVLYLTGDSTVVDQDEEPWNSWGQMLTRFLDTGVSVANYAESGQSLASSLSSRRLAKAVSTMKAGDYLFIQFGHNDMKARGEGIGPYLSYKDNLKKFIAAARSKGATPVLITPMHRRNFDENGKVVNTFGDHPDAVRQTAREEGVALIDLNNMSAELYEAWGKDGSAKGFQDGTHHNNYGSYELAKCIVEGIIGNNLGLAQHIVKDFEGFNPSSPDNPDTFYMPASPRFSMEKPLGD